jgi:DNA polymerase elongation subunit (family B)
MWFFRDDDGNFIKKHYCYVKEDDKLVVKGLKVIQGDCSKVAKEFFVQTIKPKMLDNTFKLYKGETLLNELKDFIVGREHLLFKRYRVNDPSSYKIREGKEEATGIHYQIAKKYGRGEHHLVINKRLGPGKDVHYAKMDDLKAKYGEQWINQVIFEKYLEDLSEFIIVEDKKKLKKVDRKKVKDETKED